MKRLLTALTLSAISTLATSIPATATIFKSGKTAYKLVDNSVATGWVEDGDYSRYFTYIRKGRTFQAETSWCRFGKITYDPRADINRNPPQYTTEKPGWYVGANYVIAQTPASIQMLKTVCAK
jgi:hypothetical protein